MLLFIPFIETAIACGIGRLIYDGIKSIQKPDPKSSHIEKESPALVNPLGEPLNTSISYLGSRPKNGSASSFGVSSVKARCEIEDLRVGKSSTGEEWAYILPSIDNELQTKYGEVVYAPPIYHHEVIRIERTGRPKWGFLIVEELPRCRKIVRGIAGLVTLVAGTALLTPFIGSIPAAIVSGAAALGVCKLFTLGRSVDFEAETAELHLTGYAPKRDYDILKRIVREATHKSPDVSACFQQ